MGGFNGSELATLSHSFASLGHSPSAPWLHAAMRAFHGALGSSATPPALAKMLHAMAHLRVRTHALCVPCVCKDVARDSACAGEGARSSCARACACTPAFP
eukprot:11224-Chlamydomonas_euryale.AAC.1